MERNCELKCRVSTEVIEKFGITEDSVFECYFEEGVIKIRILSAEELAEIVDNANESFDYVDGYEEGLDEGYDEGIEIGAKAGYSEGYHCGYVAGNENAPYNDKFPGVDEIMKRSCNDEGCLQCEHYCHHCGMCTLED